MSEPLDKIRQKILLNWLKQQAKQNSNLQRLSVFNGLISAIGIIMQAFLIATILQKLIIDNKQFSDILPYFILLAALFLLRTLLNYCREKIHFSLGKTLRKTIRSQIINRIEQVGPTSITQETTGGLSTLLIEQVEDLQDFYAHYLPQMQLATFIPILILIAIIPFNWAAALILFCTAPLIPFFMILVGMGASDVNRKNFKALSFLSGHFLDRLKGLQTIRLFNQGKNQTINIHNAAEDFRIKTMNVLTMAFLSSSVLEFFTSISIAVVAVYFGFSYLGEFHFGSYHQSVTLFAGFFSLILAPEFFQPLRDLGTYYHAKAQAIAAADNIEQFLTTQNLISSTPIKNSVHIKELKSITASNLIILSTNHKKIVGPLNFHLDAPFNLALMGISGEGKSSLLNVLLGFLPYEGSLKINDIEFHTLNIDLWRNQLSWLGQNPYLLNDSIRNNILLADPNADQTDLNKVIKQARLTEFIDQLPQGLDTKIGEDSVRISVGQAQRIAIARALLKPCKLLLLDEPTSSLDKQTSQEIESILFENYFKDSQVCNVIMVTHQKSDIIPFNHIWRLHNNKIHLERES